ncbi:FAD:protein FMN transferase [Klugiella xanthotipulae]|uniref:FAD:protein FMN transferase n=1 Tax=Klugiella xanthotipulae TaxID=244735 RepID=A0A543I4D8_9MICO|nr:FAD:protein FMN transferase [Klugiella xanthotipulae]TQM65411.1 thiamine biosynthesis lipoprotein [Klugiella xanthotipulae]
MPSFAFDAIGAPWQVDTPLPLSGAERGAIRRIAGDFDAAWSRFRSDSTVSRLRNAPGEVTLPPESAALAELYRALYRLTEGALSPIVGAALEHWGYGPGYRLTPLSGAPAPRPWDSSVRWSGTTLAADAPVVLDIGAAGKGCLAGLLARALDAAGHTDYTVDASGDLANRGTSLRVGLEHPFQPGQAIGVVELGDGALCASATNRRAWGDGLHHILDARTGLPVTTVAATWVLAADPAVADGLATALFSVPGETLAAEFACDYVRMFTDGRVELSPTLPGEVFRSAPAR